MDWICFVFTKDKRTYLVPSERLDDAWDSLAIKQNCSIKNCKKMFKFICRLDDDNNLAISTYKYKYD